MYDYLKAPQECLNAEAADGQPKRAGMPTTTLHLKVKPEAWSWLNKAAVEVNYVWNWANATSYRAARPFSGTPKWLSGYDLDALSSGSGPLFDRIGADTVNQINHEYATRRRQFRKSKLQWRASKGAKRSLGWIPVRGINLRFNGSRLRFMGKTFRVFEQATLLAYREAGCKLGGGSFAQNALGEWFLNVAVDVIAPTVSVRRLDK